MVHTLLITNNFFSFADQVLRSGARHNNTMVKKKCKFKIALTTFCIQIESVVK